MESGEPVVKVARNLRRETISDAVSQLSDSILARVVKTRKPLIISDALSDDEFKNSLSVVNLKLTSVMCVPLLERGNMLGVIYVGNDNVAQLFEESHMEVLTIFAAQASLLIRNALLVNELQLDKRSLQERIERIRFGEILGSSPRDAGGLPQGPEGRGDRHLGARSRARPGTGQGADRARAAQPVAARQGPVRHHQLRRHPGEPARVRAVRPRARRVHGRRQRQGRAASRPPTTARCSSTRSARCRWRLQVKILRALQERVVVQVGDTHAESIDIRVIAATNRDLEAEIKAGRFREDLYYRLNVVHLHLPPLRDRGDDIVVLARYMVGRYAPEYGGKVAGLTPNAIAAIKRHRWPGNIRELENRIKKAVVLSDKALLGPEDLDLSPDDLPPILPLAEAKEQFQRDYINEILVLNNGNRTKTARDLGVDPRTIFRHLEKGDGGELRDDGMPDADDGNGGV